MGLTPTQVVSGLYLTLQDKFQDWFPQPVLVAKRLVDQDVYMLQLLVGWRIAMSPAAIVQVMP